MRGAPFNPDLWQILQVPLYTFSPVTRSGAAAAGSIPSPSSGRKVAGVTGADTAVTLTDVLALADVLPDASVPFSLPPHPEKSASDAATISICFFMCVIIHRSANCKPFDCSGKHRRSERVVWFRHGIPHHIVHCHHLLSFPKYMTVENSPCQTFVGL